VNIINGSAITTVSAVRTAEKSWKAMAVVAGSAATCQAGKDVCISGGRSVQVKKSASIVM
jgi:hypothetical protein